MLEEPKAFLFATPSKDSNVFCFVATSLRIVGLSCQLQPWTTLPFGHHLGLKQGGNLWVQPAERSLKATGVKKMPPPRGPQVTWSIFPFTNRVFEMLFLTHSHMSCGQNYLHHLIAITLSGAFFVSLMQVLLVLVGYPFWVSVLGRPLSVLQV